MHSRHLLAILGALVAASLSPAPRARAEVHGGATVELGFQRVDDVNAFTPLLSGWVSIQQRARLEAAMGLAVLGEGGERQAAPGNPYLGVAFTLPTTRARTYAGAGVAIPVATAGPDSPPLYRGTALRAFRDQWLWAPGTLAAVISGGAATPAGGGFEATLAGDAALLVGTDDRARDGLDVDLQLVGTGTYALGRMLSLGASLTAVWVPTADGDTFQLSVEPFLRLALGPLQAQVGLTLPIDEPLGPPFADDGGWGTQFALSFAL
ncbi:MAG: hypothetical protein H6746_19950 [Deltaproteobacteria bacterium]|nr:hypothetical protein [Deltaproteobacteria bacterium]